MRLQKAGLVAGLQPAEGLMLAPFPALRARASEYSAFSAGVRACGPMERALSTVPALTALKDDETDYVREAVEEALEALEAIEGGGGA